MARQRKSKKDSSSKSQKISSAADIPLQHPPSPPKRRDSDPTDETLYELAERRQLFAQADAASAKQKQQGKSGAAAAGVPAGRLAKRGPKGDWEEERRAKTNSDDPDPSDVLSPTEQRVAESALWTFTLAMVHFTFDVLAQHQYGTEIEWNTVIVRTLRAWIVFFILFYTLHPHDTTSLPPGERPPSLIPGLPLSQSREYALRQTIFFTSSLAAGCYMIYVTNTFGYLAVMKQTPPLACLWLWSVIEMDLWLAVLNLACAGGYLLYNGYDFK